jgi:hypothetical protein
MPSSDEKFWEIVSRDVTDPELGYVYPVGTTIADEFRLTLAVLGAFFSLRLVG